MRYYDLATDSGLLVLNVVPGAPAHRGGLRERDIVVQFAGSTVANVDDLHRLLTDDRSGVDSEVQVVRGTELLKLTVTPQLRTE